MTDPLPSWREGPARAAIVDFVAAVTDADGADFVPPARRIAVFDNDGTLWCEHPMQAQVFFALDRVDALARSDPGLEARQPFKAFLERDVATIHALGKAAVFQFVFAVHAGMTVEAFDGIAREFLGRARHPVFGRPFPELVYAPQLELLAYLRANRFKTFIVSGGGADLIRAFAEEVYGIPPEQVIGSSLKLRFEAAAGSLTKVAELNTFDDREEKVANIGLAIGRRPILAFGNSDGDLAMMRYTLAGPGRRLALLLHHDDAGREVAYDREFRLSPLAEALDRADELGIRKVSMKTDWGEVFAR